MSLGSKLKEARIRKNMTQQQVADAVGVKKNTITGYEKNDRQPDVLMLKKLIPVLGISSSELLELPQYDDSVEIPVETYSERALNFAKRFDSLSKVGMEILEHNLEIIEKHHSL